MSSPQCAALLCEYILWFTRGVEFDVVSFAHGILRMARLSRCSPERPAWVVQAVWACLQAAKGLWWRGLEAPHCFGARGGVCVRAGGVYVGRDLDRAVPTC